MFYKHFEVFMHKRKSVIVTGKSRSQVSRDFKRIYGHDAVDEVKPISGRSVESRYGFEYKQIVKANTMINTPEGNDPHINEDLMDTKNYGFYEVKLVGTDETEIVIGASLETVKAEMEDTYGSALDSVTEVAGEDLASEDPLSPEKRHHMNVSILTGRNPFAESVDENAMAAIKGAITYPSGTGKRYFASQKDRIKKELEKTRARRDALSMDKEKHDTDKRKAASEETEKSIEDVIEAKRGLWANIHAKRKRIKAGSGERMRKPGSEGAPSNKDLKDSQTEEVEIEEAAYLKGNLEDRADAHDQQAQHHDEQAAKAHKAGDKGAASIHKAASRAHAKASSYIDKHLSKPAHLRGNVGSATSNAAHKETQRANNASHNAHWNEEVEIEEVSVTYAHSKAAGYGKADHHDQAREIHTDHVRTHAPNGRDPHKELHAAHLAANRAHADARDAHQNDHPNKGPMGKKANQLSNKAFKMSDKHHASKNVQEETLAEGTDKLMYLARVGLMNKNELVLLRRAMSQKSSGQPISVQTRKILFKLLDKMVSLIIKNPHMFNQAKRKVMEDAWDEALGELQDKELTETFIQRIDYLREAGYMDPPKTKAEVKKKYPDTETDVKNKDSKEVQPVKYK